MQKHARRDLLEIQGWVALSSSCPGSQLRHRPNLCRLPNIITIVIVIVIVVSNNNDNNDNNRSAARGSASQPARPAPSGRPPAPGGACLLDAVMLIMSNKRRNSN